MSQMNLLRGLFDEKIIQILNILLDNAGKQFSLTQIAAEAKVNITTTSRIIDRLVKQEVIEIIVIGKSKFYKLKRNEKTIELAKLLKKEEHLSEFTAGIEKEPNIRKVILETRTSNGAKLIIVGDLIPTEKINRLADHIKEKYDFRIQFIELSEKQFEDMQRVGLYDLEEKIIWERK